MTPEERAIATSAIRLMQGVVYQESDAWGDLLRHRGAVRDHFAVVGLDVVIDDDEGYAYLRTAETPDGEEALPRVIRRRALTYSDSLLLVLLRKRLVEFESAGDQGQLVLTHEEIVDMVQLFLARSTDEARTLKQVETSINRLVTMGFLRQLRGRKDTWEVRRILKAYVDAETLSDFSAKLAEYADAVAGNGEDGDE
ncbi:DUF4194 domain-containing protein [Dietzia maris]|uniref:DUF4194 domain-containing protein n=1 Tax=Dietzia TaxID=37914 RepID=UPI000AC14F47|nr:MULTISPECIES: DUF4194 domain-containing protein [Dietzia]MCT1433992.1 DUF4194 domain-containing protein [Dietzia maris]MCT1521112.1 DUF4194 domain-containing protein [Dietzia maris]